ncbi:MAG: GAF domain-containing protein [Anaerolineae bacterium]
MPVESVMTLDGALKQLVQTIQEMADRSEIRVYLWDRDAEALVEPGSRAVPDGSLALDAYASGRAIHRNNLRRDPQAQVASWRNGAGAAAAVPIQQRRGVVGVIEMQSAAPNAFSAQMLETVGRLAAQVAPGIEDRWLLESGWLTQQVRECLRNLQDDVFLNHCPLADWLPVNDLIRRSEIVRQILCDAMDHTLPETANSSERAARRYQILIQTYMQQIPVDTICQNLSVSRRQYFYDLKDAIDVVVDYLFTQREYLTLRYDSAPVTH